MCVCVAVCVWGGADCVVCVCLCRSVCLSHRKSKTKYLRQLVFSDHLCLRARVCVGVCSLRLSLRLPFPCLPLCLPVSICLSVCLSVFLSSLCLPACLCLSHFSHPVPVCTPSLTHPRANNFTHAHTSLTWPGMCTPACIITDNKARL